MNNNTAEKISETCNCHVGGAFICPDCRQVLAARKAAKHLAQSTLEYIMRDAHQALLVAQRDNRWLDVAKYATQIATAQQDLARMGTLLTIVGQGTVVSEAA